MYRFFTTQLPIPRTDLNHVRSLTFQLLCYYPRRHTIILLVNESFHYSLSSLAVDTLSLNSTRPWRPPFWLAIMLTLIACSMSVWGWVRFVQAFVKVDNIFTSSTTIAGPASATSTKRVWASKSPIECKSPVADIRRCQHEMGTVTGPRWLHPRGPLAGQSIMSLDDGYKGLLLLKGYVWRRFIMV